MEKETKKEVQLTQEEIIKNLTEELAQEKAGSIKLKSENERYKHSIESLGRESEELRKQVRQQVREFKKSATLEKEKEKKVNEELSEMEKQLKKEKSIRKYVRELGMDEKTAKEMATAEIEKDMDTWGKTLEEYIRNVKREAANNAIQKFLAERPDIKAGNGDAEIHSSIDIALNRVNHDSGVNTDVLRKYM